MSTSVLVVEDDLDLALALSVRLRASGYVTSVAQDAVTALSQVRKTSPDVVLLDLGLPGGDGITLLERMRVMPGLALIPVIVLTARDDSWREASLAAGAQDFLQKPADPEELLDAIEAVLHTDVHATLESSTMDRTTALGLLRSINEESAKKTPKKKQSEDEKGGDRDSAYEEAINRF